MPCAVMGYRLSPVRKQSLDLHNEFKLSKAERQKQLDEERRLSRERKAKHPMNRSPRKGKKRGAKRFSKKSVSWGGRLPSPAKKYSPRRKRSPNQRSMARQYSRKNYWSPPRAVRKRSPLRSPPPRAVRKRSSPRKRSSRKRNSKWREFNLLIKHASPKRSRSKEKQRRPERRSRSRQKRISSAERRRDAKYSRKIKKRSRSLSRKILNDIKALTSSERRQIIKKRSHNKRKHSSPDVKEFLRNIVPRRVRKYKESPIAVPLSTRDVAVSAMPSPKKNKSGMVDNIFDENIIRKRTQTPKRMSKSVKTQTSPREIVSVQTTEDITQTPRRATATIQTQTNYEPTSSTQTDESMFGKLFDTPKGWPSAVRTPKTSKRSAVRTSKSPPPPYVPDDQLPSPPKYATVIRDEPMFGNVFESIKKPKPSAPP